jgi:hypothetical protein
MPILTRASSNRMDTRSGTKNRSVHQFIELPQANKHKNKRKPASERVIVANPHIISKPDECAKLEDDEMSLESALPESKTLDDDVKIGFEDASREWHLNKKMSNGMYVYICGKVRPGTSLVCTKQCHDNIGLYSGCHQHFMWEERENKYIYES